MMTYEEFFDERMAARHRAPLSQGARADHPP